jgi:hypothetical protein
MSTKLQSSEIDGNLEKEGKNEGQIDEKYRTGKNVLAALTS